MLCSMAFNQRFMSKCPENFENVLLISGSQDKISWWILIPAKALYGLAQDCRDFIANALELAQPCTKPWRWSSYWSSQAWLHSEVPAFPHAPHLLLHGSGYPCLVHPAVLDKRREIHLSQPRHETASWWRHNGPVTSQLTDPIKLPN